MCIYDETIKNVYVSIIAYNNNDSGNNRFYEQISTKLKWNVSLLWWLTASNEHAKSNGSYLLLSSVLIYSYATT